MRAFEIDVDLEDANLTGLASNIDSSGTSLTFDGALISGGTFTSADGLGRIIVIVDSDTDTQSDVTFTITGIDAQGDAITNTITGPGSGATVASTKYFKMKYNIIHVQFKLPSFSWGSGLFALIEETKDELKMCKLDEYGVPHLYDDGRPMITVTGSGESEYKVVKKTNLTIEIP